MLCYAIKTVEQNFLVLTQFTFFQINPDSVLKILPLIISFLNCLHVILTDNPLKTLKVM